MSFIRICCPALGLPICAFKSFLMELTNLPAFVRPSRSERQPLAERPDAALLAPGHRGAALAGGEVLSHDRALPVG